MSTPACSQKSVVEAKQKPTSMHKFKMLSSPFPKKKNKKEIQNTTTNDTTTGEKKRKKPNERKKISNNIHKHESAITHRPRKQSKAHKTHRKAAAKPNRNRYGKKK